MRWFTNSEPRWNRCSGGLPRILLVLAQPQLLTLQASLVGKHEEGSFRIRMKHIFHITLLNTGHILTRAVHERFKL